MSTSSRAGRTSLQLERPVLSTGVFMRRKFVAWSDSLGVPGRAGGEEDQRVVVQMAAAMGAVLFADGVGLDFECLHDLDAEATHALDDLRGLAVDSRPFPSYQAEFFRDGIVA